MQPVPQDLLKEYVQSQHFTSTTEIMEAMKEMFRDVIQTVMEVEMDEELGRERCERSDEPEGTPRNYRNGYTKKTVKTQLGEVDIKVPRDRNGSFEPKIHPGTRRRFSCQSGPAVVQWPRNNRSSGRREVLRKEETAMREIRKKRAVAVEVRRERKWLMQ